ncbi:SET domain-containing protein [Patescibacteria group bacterium]|nr:SET domain-containing protein [Patescibacteria group bacterium]
MQKKVQGKFSPGDFRLKVKRSSAGLGLYAEEAIPKGKCIIEYTGRVISKEEEYKSRSKYLFEINKDKTIDGTTRRNTARYINHSCRPNAEVEIRKGRVFILARRAIKEGEELSYDYGKEYIDEHIKPYGCRCIKCKPSLHVLLKKSA